MLPWHKISHVLAIVAVVVAELVDIFFPNLNLLSVSDNFLLFVLGLIVVADFAKPDLDKQRKFFDVVKSWPDFPEYAKDAHDIFIAGGSLDFLIQQHRDFLVKKAKAGCTVRLIIMDPKSPALEQVELWSSPNLPPGYYRDRICETIRFLKQMPGHEMIKVRLNQSIPSLAVVILDGNDSTGKIRVDIQPFQARSVERPVFELLPRGEDKQWYNMFYRQYSERLWEQAKEIALSDFPLN